MATEPLLDFEHLLAPIPGDNPAGEPVPYMTRQQLEDFRKGTDVEEFDEKDPRRPESPVPPDWESIIQLAKEVLETSSKDLLVAARLTEALTCMYGFRGLRDGLHLILLMVEQCWDRVFPAIEEEDDLEIRSAPFNWLDDPDRGARFPTAVRLIPMVEGEAGPCSWIDWKRSQGGTGSISAADFEAAVQHTPREVCKDQFEDLDETRTYLDQITEDLNERLGQAAPGMLGLRQAVSDCRILAEQILERKGPDPATLASDDDSEESVEGGEGESGGEKSVKHHVASREQIYRHLLESAQLLRQLEPHSPIPYLLERAVALGALPFPELMKTLIRDDGVLEEMARELGIEPSGGD